jgi:hypothetical protein
MPPPSRHSLRRYLRHRSTLPSRSLCRTAPHARSVAPLVRRRAEAITPSLHRRAEATALPLCSLAAAPHPPSSSPARLVASAQSPSFSPAAAAPSRPSSSPVVAPSSFAGRGRTPSSFLASAQSSRISAQWRTRLCLLCRSPSPSPRWRPPPRRATWSRLPLLLRRRGRGCCGCAARCSTTIGAGAAPSSSFLAGRSPLPPLPDGCPLPCRRGLLAISTGRAPGTDANTSVHPNRNDLVAL